MVQNKSEERRLLAALKDLDSLVEAEQWEETQPKNLGESVAARRAGNELYASDKSHDAASHLEALRLYSKSVAFALPASNELGLAYGNRSALLMHLGRYEDCIGDLERALELPVDDLRRVKYLCRKVECESMLGMQEARKTCELAQTLIVSLKASKDVKRDAVITLVNAMVELEKRESAVMEVQTQKAEAYHAEKFKKRSDECPDASSALVITKASRNFFYGRYLTASRDIVPGETLYAGEPLLVMPARTRVHSHCSHCLDFAWAGLPCDGCSQAVYCSEDCRTEAYRMYHDVECKIIDRIWKGCGPNAGRIMSVRLLLMAMRKAGGLHELRDSLEEVDGCTDLRRKGFSDNQRVFLNNYISAYSLQSNVRKIDERVLQEVSEDSAVILYLLSNYTRVFRKYFDYDKRDLINSEDALFVGKLLSHFHHVILMNATSVKDTYNVSSTDWNWSVPCEESSSGLYLNPFLSLLNHSCYPNVAKTVTKERKTILFAIRPIAEGEQIFDCYGPMYSEMLKKKRDELIKRFCFTCNCIACAENWPVFMNMLSSGVTYLTLSTEIINATANSLAKCDQIIKLLKNGNYKSNLDALEELAYTITLTVKYCKMPNWRLPSLISTFISVFNDLYGYVVEVPDIC